MENIEGNKRLAINQEKNKYVRIDNEERTWTQKNKEEFERVDNFKNLGVDINYKNEKCMEIYQRIT